MTRAEARTYVRGEILARQLPGLPAVLRPAYLAAFGLPGLVRLDDGRRVAADAFAERAAARLLEHERTQP